MPSPQDPRGNGPLGSRGDMPLALHHLPSGEMEGLFVDNRSPHLRLQEFFQVTLIFEQMDHLFDQAEYDYGLPKGLPACVDGGFSVVGHRDEDSST